MLPAPAFARNPRPSLPFCRGPTSPGDASARDTVVKLVLRPQASPRSRPARKALEDFDFEHARGLKRDLIAHLGGQDFVAAKDNVLNRPGFSQAWIHNHARVSFPGCPTTG